MAKQGKTIICTIHQPSSEVFEKFDTLCLLAEGRLAYLGNLNEAENYFNSLNYPVPQNFNPADHYIRTLAIVPNNREECLKIIEVKINLSFFIKNYKKLDIYILRKFAKILKIRLNKLSLILISKKQTKWSMIQI